MKTIAVNLYTYPELDKQAQEKARREFEDINTFSGWWDADYEDFINLCKYFGIETSEKQISFSGFWSQGDGSTFSSSIDPLKLIQGVASQSWKEYAPDLELRVTPCNIDHRILRLIENGVIEVSMSTDQKYRGYYIQFNYEANWRNSNSVIPRIEAELQVLEQWAEDVLKELNRYLYHNLQKTYEYLISEEAIKETIESNGYLFTSDGSHADWLISISSPN